MLGSSNSPLLPKELPQLPHFEMFNQQNEMIGDERTKQLFQEITHESPGQVIDHLVDEGKKWANGRPQEDDVTFVVMKVK